jgi:hypothetical protein
VLKRIAILSSFFQQVFIEGVVCADTVLGTGNAKVSKQIRFLLAWSRQSSGEAGINQNVTQMQPGTGGHTCNPSYSGGWQFKVSMGKKFAKPYYLAP